MPDNKKDIQYDDFIEIENPDLTPDPDGKEDAIDCLMEDPFNPSEINIMSRSDSLGNIIERLKYDKIDMNTDFQRHGSLWSNFKTSRLIESILIRLPLPPFYFDASNDGKWLIVDGLQRLSAIRKFVIEKDKDKKLKLTGLEYLKKFQGYDYDSLPRTYKRRIDECQLTLFLIQPGTPDTVKYSIFKRINTGGVVLNDQEIRNAMTKPEIRIFLEELVDNPYLKKAIGDQSRRMVDQEMALRFLAFRFLDYEKSKKNISTFLDKMIYTLEKASQTELENYKYAFKIAVNRCWLIFGDKAFEKSTNLQSPRRKRKNTPLFEVWTNAVSTLSESEAERLIQSKNKLVQKHVNLMASDNDYFRSITYSTQKKDHFRIRKGKVDQIIKEVLNA